MSSETSNTDEDIQPSIDDSSSEESDEQHPPSPESLFKGPQDTQEFLASLHKDFSLEFLWVFLMGFVGTILGFTAFDGLFLDIYANLNPAEEVSDDVTVISIGPESLHLWDPDNRSPEVTPRAMLAELITILTELEAATISLDILLDAPAPGDNQLLQAAQKHGAVIAAEKAKINMPSQELLFTTGITPSLLATEGPTVQLSHANLYFTEPILFTDNLIFRGIPLVLGLDRSSVSGTWPQTAVGAKEEVFSPALSLASAWLYKARQSDPNASLMKLSYELSQNCERISHGVLCKTSKVSHLPDLKSKLHDIYWLRHTGSEQNDHIRFISASTLLLLRAETALLRGMNIPAEQIPQVKYPESIRKSIKDKAILIGRVDMDVEPLDRHPTTYSFPFFTEKDMSGVHIQAQLIERLLTGKSIRFFPAWLYWLLGVGTAYLSWLIVKRKPISLQVPYLTLYLVSLFLMGFLLMKYGGWVLELSIPTTTGVLSFIGCHLWYSYSKVSDT